jgi:hypothetical protein
VTIRCLKAGSASAESAPCVWLWNVTVHLTGGLEALKARTAPEQLEAAYRAMNIWDED